MGAHSVTVSCLWVVHHVVSVCQTFGLGCGSSVCVRSGVLTVVLSPLSLPVLVCVTGRKLINLNKRNEKSI